MKELKRTGSDYNQFMNTPSSIDKSPEEKGVLSFEDFCQRYNNFLLYFYKHLGSYRKKAHFIRFQQENVDLEEELTILFSNTVGQGQPNENQNIRLYEACKIMRTYWLSDGELFT